MNYQISVSKRPDNTDERSIIITQDSGLQVSFPAENENPHYISFLRQLSEENPDDPHYLAWVEAGNNPEEFWTQEGEG